MNQEILKYVQGIFHSIHKDAAEKGSNVDFYKGEIAVGLIDSDGYINTIHDIVNPGFPLRVNTTLNACAEVEVALRSNGLEGVAKYLSGYDTWVAIAYSGHDPHHNFSIARSLLLEYFGSIL